MSVWEQLRESLSPHAERLNQTIAATGMILHNRLQRIEDAVSNASRPNFGDHYLRFGIKAKFKAGEKIEIGECPMSEVWQIQALCVDGVQNTSPAFIIFIDDEGKLVESIVKEGIGLETPGGDIGVLPGETLFFQLREEGTVAFTLYIVRQQVPTRSMYRHAAAAGELLEASNTHDPLRDVIAQATPQVYQEIPSPPADAEDKESMVGESGSQRSTIRR